MIEIIKELDIEVSKPNIFQAIVAKQYDMNTRFLKVTLKDSGTRIDIPNIETAKVVINAERKDGQSKGFDGVINDDGTVTVPLHSWMLELEGTVICDISVIDIAAENNKKLTTTSFTLIVEKAAYGGDDVTNDPQYDVLVQLIEDCKDVLKTAEDLKDGYTSVTLYSGDPLWSSYDFSGGLGLAYGKSTNPLKFDIEEGMRYKLIFSFEDNVGGVNAIGFYNEEHIYTSDVCEGKYEIDGTRVEYDCVAKVSGSFYAGVSTGNGEHFAPTRLLFEALYSFEDLLEEVKSIPVQKGEGDNSAQQILDNGSYSWIVNNPSVIELLVNTGLITINEDGKISNIGALGNFSSVFGGKGLALGKRSSVRGTSSIAYGSYAIAEGDQALAYGDVSRAIGCGTTAIGIYSLASGVGAVSEGNASDAGGTECIAKGHSTFTRGYKNEAIGMFSTVFGSENIANQSCQVVVGKHNNNKSDTLFEVGNGNDQQSKANAFEVYADGHAEVQTQGTTDNSVATVGFVNGLAGGTDVEEGTWTPTVSSVAEGISVSFSDSNYVKNGKEVRAMTKMKIDYEGISEDSTGYLFSNSMISGLPITQKNGGKFESFFTIGGTLSKATVEYGALSVSASHLNTSVTRCICGFSVLTKSKLYGITYKNSGSLTAAINIAYLTN